MNDHHRPQDGSELMAPIAGAISHGRIFLLSPAKVGGPRTAMLFREGADFALARRLREDRATIGEIYSFISGLYFRGKLMYADTFRAAAPPGMPPALVIVPGAGLIPSQTIVSAAQLRAIAEISVDEDNPRFRDPLTEAARLLDEHAQQGCSYVLRAQSTRLRFCNSSETVCCFLLISSAEVT